MKKIDCFRKLKNEKGFMSIEAVMAMATILMIVLLGVGLFTYMMPRQAIEEELHLLGRTAKMQGGLTDSDVNQFKENMKKRGMVEDKNIDDVKVIVNLETTSGEPFPGYESRPNIINTIVNRGYGKKEAGQYAVMKIRVEVPANKSGIKGAMSFFGGDEDLPDAYVFSERIMSEYYGGTP